MNQSQILVRYGEIGLKSENIRRQFTKQLKKNIKYACSKEKISVTIAIERGRFFIHTTEIGKTRPVLKKIFGIVSFSPVWESSSVLSELSADAIGLLQNYLTPKTSFALRVRRSGIHEFTSQDAAVHIGQAVCDEFNCPVDLEHPTVELFIEIRNERAFLFLEKIKGVGGLPYATQGKICCFVESALDVLASWFLMKRGCSVQFIIMDESLLDQVNTFLKKWYISQTPYFLEKNTKEDFRNSNMINEPYKCKAICSGLRCERDKKEVIQKIKKLQTQFCLPVLTPLISMNDRQIQSIAGKVGIDL